MLLNSKIYIIFRLLKNTEEMIEVKIKTDSIFKILKMLSRYLSQKY